MNSDEIIRAYGSLELAYIGDAAYELMVRRHILKESADSNGVMHKKALTFVSSAAQDAAAVAIAPLLNDTEQAVMRRGRNAKSHSHPKNADIAKYHNATGFEAVWGFLYLSESYDRLNELFDIIVKTVAK